MKLLFRLVCEDSHGKILVRHFHAQFRMVGNNYNQTLKELKSHFSERRTAVLVYKLEKYMMQLMQIMHKVVELTNRYEKRLIGKDN